MLFSSFYDKIISKKWDRSKYGKPNFIRKKEFYNKYKSKLSKEILEKIEKAFDIDFTYHSTTIEGNTLYKWLQN